MPTARPSRSAPGGSQVFAEAATCASRTPAGATTRTAPRRRPATASWRSTCGGPRAQRSWTSSCRAHHSTTEDILMSWRSTRCRTTPLPSCTRSTERTCGTRTRRSPPCASCTTAPTTRSWMCSSSMASSRRPTSRPRIGAQSRAARGSAPRCATTTASIAWSGIIGTSATCSAWASTSRTSRRSRTATARGPSCCPMAAAASAWCCARCWAGPSRWRATSSSRRQCTTSATSAPSATS
mmetsp:Transcript_39228/g.99620  ORF Transcript_39228/g.99620 Transcript_39228/m.99620 type:complete len:239 (-) Transcript_39228:454-1170(-)